MNRKTAETRMKRTSDAIRLGVEKVQNLRWQLAGEAFAFRATFPAGGEKAALAQAATITGFSEGDIGNLIRAYEVTQDLTPAQREKVSSLSWTTDAALTLRGKGMTAAKRNALLKYSEDKGTRNVKDLRAKKAQLIGATGRNRQSQKDANIALAKKLGPAFEKLAKRHDVLSLIAGAQLAQDNPGSDIAAVLTFWNAQREAAAKKVAA